MKVCSQYQSIIIFFKFLVESEKTQSQRDLNPQSSDP